MEIKQDKYSTIHVNQFHHQMDNKVKLVGEFDWSTLSDFFLNAIDVTTDKKSVQLFNLANYKSIAEISDPHFLVAKDNGHTFPRRKQGNILFMDALVFDYDGALSIDEAKKKFSKYSYIGYTSHSNLESNGIEKFRIIIQLTTPIPAAVVLDTHRNVVDRGLWGQINQALRDLAGPADPKSFETNTIYHLPSVHPDRRELYQCWVNNGQAVDWTELPTSLNDSKIGSCTDSSSTKVKDGNLRLLPDMFLSTSKGRIQVGDIDGHISGVVCPFHGDTKGSEFVNKSLRGNVYLYCKHCGTVFVNDHDSSVPESPCQEGEKQSAPDFDDILEFPTVYHDTTDRTLVKKQLEKISGEIRNDIVYGKFRSYRRHQTRILFMPEGSGKSSLARELASLGEKIIFACKSWDQAFEKYDELREYGLTKGFSVDLFLSRDGKARRRFGVKVERGESRSPYRIGSVLDDETLIRFAEKNPHLSDELIRVSWSFFEPDQFFVGDFLPDRVSCNQTTDEMWDQSDRMFIGKDADVLVTTHAQLRFINEGRFKIPKNRIVWIDDPDIWDVLDIEAYDKERHGVIDFDNPPTGTKEINGTLYFERNKRQSLGFGQKNQTCVYTTTETLTLQAIEKLLKDRKEKYVLHDEMNFLSGGRITILGTSKVQKKTDAIIPIISRLLEKEGFDNVLIANGLGTAINHSNSKGNNQLRETTILVELSQPHPVEKFTCCDALEINRGQNANSVGQQLVLDRLHQAIGRNSGYRSAGYECVILADSHIHKYLVENVRYLIDEKNSVQIDRTQDMSRNDQRTTENASKLVVRLESLINNIDQLVSDTRRIKPAIKFVVEHIENDTRRESYIARLLLSVSTHSGKNFWVDENIPLPETRLETQYQDLGNWVLKEFVPTDRRDSVLREYRETVKN